MPNFKSGLSRRHLLASAVAVGAAGLVPGSPAAAPAMMTRPIPSSGERLPVIGMGTWVTFNVGDDMQLRARCVDVFRAFFQAGGGMIDSSPMYGSAEEVIGYCLKQLGANSPMFSATKVWTPLKWHGAKQIKASQELRGEDKFDLFQVHNLVNWEGHLDTLQAMKSEGRLRYVGITTSHGSRHEEMAKIMATQAIDFVQFTYNVEDRDPEARLLGLAADKGIAVIINRPFQRGSLLDRFQGKPLPPWAADIACTSWAQFSLKFIVSHPAVTCAIPATSRVDHMHENMNVGRGPLPDMKTRARMAAYVKDL